MKIRKLIILTFFIIGACSGRYASLGVPMSKCGFKSVPYNDFHSCMEKKLAVDKNANPDDYYTKTSLEFMSVLDEYKVKLENNQIKEKNAYIEITSFYQPKNY